MHDPAGSAAGTNWGPEAGFLRPSREGPGRDAANLTMPQLDFAFRRAWALALLAGLVASAFGVLLGVQVRGELQDQAAIATERAALEPVRALLEALRLTQQHRALAAEVLGGDDTAEAPRGALQARLDDAMARVNLQLEQAHAAASARADWAEVRRRWTSLASAVARRALGAADSLARHGELIEAQLDVHDRLTEGPLRAVDALWSSYRGALEQERRLLAQARATRAEAQAAAATTQSLRQRLSGGLAQQARRLDDRRREAERRAVMLAAAGLGLLVLGLGLAVQALVMARRRPGRHGADTEAAQPSGASPAAIGRRVVAGLARPVGEPAGPPRAAAVETDDEAAPR